MEGELDEQEKKIVFHLKDASVGGDKVSICLSCAILLIIYNVTEEV